MGGSRRVAPSVRPAKETKGIRIPLIKTDFADRSVTGTPPLATSRDDICSTTSACVKHSTGPNAPDGCAVVKDPLAPRCAWSAADRGAVYPDGNPDHVLEGVQTYGVPAEAVRCSRLSSTEKRAGEGLYPFVTHSFADAERGAVGIIQVGVPKLYAHMNH